MHLHVAKLQETNQDFYYGIKRDLKMSLYLEGFRDILSTIYRANWAYLTCLSSRKEIYLVAYCLIVFTYRFVCTIYFRE